MQLAGIVTGLVTGGRATPAYMVPQLVFARSLHDAAIPVIIHSKCARSSYTHVVGTRRTTSSCSASRQRAGWFLSLRQPPNSVPHGQPPLDI